MDDIWIYQIPHDWEELLAEAGDRQKPRPVQNLALLLIIHNSSIL